MGDLNREYRRDVPHALGVEAPHQRLRQPRAQHPVLVHQHKVIGIR